MKSTTTSFLTFVRHSTLNINLIPSFLSTKLTTLLTLLIFQTIPSIKCPNKLPTPQNIPPLKTRISQKYNNSYRSWLSCLKTIYLLTSWNTTTNHFNQTFLQPFRTSYIQFFQQPPSQKHRSSPQPQSNLNPSQPTEKLVKNKIHALPSHSKRPTKGRHNSI